MSDLYNFQLTSSDNEDKDQEVPQQKESFGFSWMQPTFMARRDIKVLLSERNSKQKKT